MSEGRVTGPFRYEIEGELKVDLKKFPKELLEKIMLNGSLPPLQIFLPAPSSFRTD